MDQLVEIRHTKVVTKRKKGEEYQESCNALLVRVSPGSSGTAHCIKCDEQVTFEVAKDNQSIYDILKEVKPA